MRVHLDFGTRLFTPTDSRDPPPIPMEKVDVGRETIVHSLFGGSQTIEDMWDGTSPEDRRELEDCWTGETKFWRNDVKTLDDFRADAVGRKTRQQTTTRVPWIDPDTWNVASPKDRKQWIARNNAVRAAR